MGPCDFVGGRHTVHLWQFGAADDFVAYFGTGVHGAVFQSGLACRRKAPPCCLVVVVFLLSIGLLASNLNNYLVSFAIGIKYIVLLHIGPQKDRTHALTNTQSLRHSHWGGGVVTTQYEEAHSNFATMFTEIWQEICQETEVYPCCGSAC